MLFDTLMDILNSKHELFGSNVQVTSNKIQGKSFLIFKKNGEVIECILLYDEKLKIGECWDCQYYNAVVGGCDIGEVPSECSMKKKL